MGPDGAPITLHTQDKMVPAMVTLNVHRQQQCQGTPTMRDPFLQYFGFLADTPSADAFMSGTYSFPPLA